MAGSVCNVLTRQRGKPNVDITFSEKQKRIEDMGFSEFIEHLKKTHKGFNW